MITKRIRQITVEAVTNIPDSDKTNYISMVYTVGAKRNFKIEGQDVTRTISNIVETEKGFKLYITNENTTQEWMEFFSKERITVFNFID